MSTPAYRIPEVPQHPHPPGCACGLAVAYLRVSKVGKRERIISPELQLDAIVAFARTNHIRIVAVVADIDKSGKTFTKRSVDKIIAQISKGTYSRVLLWKWSRWARNLEASTKYLKMVRDAGGRVDSATEDADQETAIGRLQMDLVMRFDQYQSEVIGETWSAVHERRREDGLPHDGRPRFGYDYGLVAEDGEEKYRYVPNEAAPALAQAYADYLAAVSFERLAIRFNQLGLKTTLGGAWTPQGVARMMDTGFAAGLIRERQNPTDVPANSIRSYDVWREGSHTPIISTATWDAYKLKRTNGESAVRADGTIYEVSSLVICALCGRRMQPKETGAARTLQWTCLWQRSFHRAQSVSASHRLLISHLRGWIRDVAGAGDEVDARAADKLAQPDVAPDRRAELDGEIKRWTQKIGRLMDLYTDGVFDKETVDARALEYKGELEKVKAERDALGEAPVVVRPDYRAFRTLDEEWASLPTAGIRDALRFLVAGVVVSPRTAASSNKTVEDRVDIVGRWESSSRIPALKRAA